MSNELTVEEIKKALVGQMMLQNNIRQEDIGWDHTFAEHGFDSLDGVELIMGIEDELDIDLPRDTGDIYRASMLVGDLPAAIHKELYGHATES